MKKNVMMRTASALLVLVLLTTCIISGTFAKYITSAEGSDSARVAYWGFDKDASIDIDLFDGEYKNATGDITVKSSNGENVIAPGTSKEAKFAFGSIYTQNNGKSITAPEVDYNFTITPTVTGNYTALDNNPNFKWILKDPKTSTTTEYQKVSELLDAIKTMDGFNDGKKAYKSGTLPEIFTDGTKAYTIGWVWEFEDNTNDAAKATQDATDTDMGNATDLGNVKITITVTATQID